MAAHQAAPSLGFSRQEHWMGCHFLLQCMKWKVKVKLLSRVQLLATPWTAAYQAPLSMGFSRQEYWSGLPLPSPYFSKALIKSVGLLWIVWPFKQYYFFQYKSMGYFSISLNHLQFPWLVCYSSQYISFSLPWSSSFLSILFLGVYHYKCKHLSSHGDRSHN